MSEQGPETPRPREAEGPSLWVVVVEFDKIALAAALFMGLAVMAFNTFVLDVASPLVVLFRALVTFIAAWLAVFVLLFAIRHYTLRQLAVDGQRLDTTVGQEEEMQSNETAS